MAMPARELDFGVDVAKASVQIDGEGLSLELSNTTRDLRTWLKRLPSRACFALEATSTFHLTFANLAHELGHAVYLIDGFRLSRYREGIGGRAKTDVLDAQLLRRYLSHEKQSLRLWTPPPAGYSEMLKLLNLRERCVSARVMIEQSMAGVGVCKRELSETVRKMRALEALLGQRIEACARRYWAEQVRRCRQIEGVGPITSAALAAIYQRGSFRSSDAFVAFIGLDVQARDSGTQRGRRKLSKRGNAELRRLLYTAAMTACRSGTWKPYYQKLLARGLKKIQALVALSRKLARVAFTLMKNECDYQPEMRSGGCLAT